LSARSVPDELHERLVKLSHGHPLALTLMSEVKDNQVTERVLEDMPELLGELVARFVADVPSAKHRQALELCAHVRFTSESLLRAVVDDAQGPELFAWLRGLSFMTQSREGLWPHMLARDVIDSDLRWRDPECYRQQHLAAFDFFAERLHKGPLGEKERRFFDFLYLGRASALMRGMFNFDALGSGWADAPASFERQALLELAKHQEGPENLPIVKHWLDTQPGAFVVLRSPLGEPCLFFVHLVLDALREEDARADPAIASIRRYIDGCGGLGSDERIVVSRFGVSGDDGTGDGRLRHMRPLLLWLTTPKLAFSFSALRQAELWAPGMRLAMHEPVAEAGFKINDRQQVVFGHDWRARPMARWLALLVERQLATSEDALALPSVPQYLKLARADFEEAVKNALRNLSQHDALSSNVLLGTRMLAAEDGANAETLRALIDKALASLSEHPRDAKLLRALEVIYVRPAPTQEAAAERLGVPFSSFRRHLKKGTERVIEWLWQREQRS
jgi:DNA-directed RNA polymerase specialized sigma24 family protein